MTSTVTASTTESARDLVAGKRGILAADESIATMSSRLEAVGVAPTEENRRAYREMLVTTPGLGESVSGVILCDETLRQSLADGRSFPRALADLGMQAGIKVDTGARALAGRPGETVTEGLDGLDTRLAEYAELGARFAKWRAVIRIGDRMPSLWALQANAHALARYARACQNAGIVPIVEPEVLMDGTHSMWRCAAATAATLISVTRALTDADVDPTATVLKPNMVLPGNASGQPATASDVARMTIDTLRTAVSDDLAGIAFLSGGQPPETASANLEAMQQIDTPWPVTFSFGRALVSPALADWRGERDRVGAGQATLARHVVRNAGTLRGGRPALRLA